MPAHRKDFCGTCHLPLAGDNLYVDPTGRRGCRNCRARNNTISKARQRARKLAAKAKRTRKDPDRFAALVAAIRAELIVMTPSQRARHFPPLSRETTRAERAVREFADRRVARQELGTVTSLSDDGISATISQYLRRAQRAYAAAEVTPITMPLPATDGTWRMGDLALWRAAIWPKHSLGNPGRWDTGPDEDVLPVAAQVIGEVGRGASRDEIREALAGAGLAGVRANVGRDRVGRLVREHALKAVHPGTPEGPQRAVQESLRWDRRLTAAQLAADYDVSPAAVYGAVKRKELTPLREGRRMFFDPAQVAARHDGRPGPVDADHDLALKPARL